MYLSVDHEKEQCFSRIFCSRYRVAILFQFGVTPWFCFLNRVLDENHNKLFELFRFFELYQVQIL